jgi:tripartite-type tricarboxylate transporter receptor subunit TctC
VLTRNLAQHLSERVGSQVIVENRPGANGLIGTDAAAKSLPDGYTLVMGVIGPLTVMPHLVKMPYDPMKDLAPIAMLASVANIVVVPKDSPLTSMKDLIETARRRPGELAFGSVGVGSSGQLSAGLLSGMAGIKLSNIGYSGGAPAMTDLLGGRLAFMFDNAPTSLPRVRSGQLRALAITSARRSPLVPELPTIAELGYPGYEAGSWFAALAPAQTPQPIIERLNRELVAILKDPAASAKLTSQMFDLMPSTPEELSRFMASESRKWAKVIAENNIKAE